MTVKTELPPKGSCPHTDQHRPSFAQADPAQSPRTLEASTLAAALRALGGRQGWETSVRVEVRAAGSLDTAVARAAHRAAALALRSACAEGRATLVRLEARLDTDPVVLRILDDGVGLVPRHLPPRPGIAFELRRALSPVNGTVRVRDLAPHGVLVELAVRRNPGAGGLSDPGPHGPKPTATLREARGTRRPGPPGEGRRGGPG